MVIEKLIKMNLLLIIFIVAMSGNCTKDIVFKDDELSFQRIPYTGNQLRVDGYYYQKKDGKFFTMYCFYRDGIVLYLGGGFTSGQIIELEDRIQNGSFYQDIKNQKDYWGVFKIENTSILFEKWYPSSGGGLPAYVRAGEILNDTTFVITESYRMQGGKKKEVRERNETYHFRKFSPKPDSTNIFIK